MSANMIAGPHDLYWMEAGVSSGAATLGSTGPEGITSNKTLNMEMIQGDQLGGETNIDGVYQGGNLILQFTIQEVKLAIVKKFLNPITEDESAVTGGPEYVGVVGAMLSTYFGTLQIMPRTNTPAASLNASGGNGRQYTGLVISPLLETLDYRTRFVPVTFQCFPFADAGDSNKVKWWKWITTVS